MKIRDINTVVGILNDKNITRVPDAKVRATLLNDYLHLFKFSSDVGKEVEEAKKKFQKDWGDVIGPVEELRKNGKPTTGYEEYVEAERDAQAVIDSLLDQEVETSVKPVKMEAFLNAFKNENVSLLQVGILTAHGILEE